MCLTLLIVYRMLLSEQVLVSVSFVLNFEQTVTVTVRAHKTQKTKQNVKLFKTFVLVFLCVCLVLCCAEDIIVVSHMWIIDNIE